MLKISFFQFADVPSVRYFCIFAATAVMMNYVYQVTFFAGIMVLTGRREMAGQHALTCQKILPKSETSKIYYLKIFSML